MRHVLHRSRSVIKDAVSAVVIFARAETRKLIAKPAIIDSPVVPRNFLDQIGVGVDRARKIESQSGNCFDCGIITLTLIYRHFGFEPPRGIIACWVVKAPR